jgi:pimeloyl-ACP methyl ester carboxylesterase
VKNAAAIFVHGLFSSPQTWAPITSLLERDDEIAESYELRSFEYYSPKWKLSLTRRIPNFDTIAASLSTFLEVECADFQNIVLVGHSQGGLIIQRYLAQMLADGRGRELARVARVVMFACPNNGSEFFLIARRAIDRIWLQRQERELRPYADAVVETQRRILNNVIYASSITSDKCPIVFSVYVGESDNIVTPVSAKSVFPKWGALPGDHNSILRADSVDHRTFTTLKANLLLALKESEQGIPLLPSEAPVASLSPDGNLEYRMPLMKVTMTTRQLDLTESREIQIFDPSVADLYIQRDKTSLPPTGEEVDSSE